MAMTIDVAFVFLLFMLTPRPSCAAACCFPTRFSAILTENTDISTEGASGGAGADHNNRMDLIGGVRLFVDYEREEFAVFSDIHQRYVHFRIGRFMMLAPLDGGPRCHAWHNVGQPLNANLRPSMGFAVLLFQCPNPSVGFINTFRSEHMEEWSLSGLRETEGKSNHLNQTIRARICMNTPGYTCEPNVHTTTYRERVFYQAMGAHGRPSYEVIDKLVTRQWIFNSINVPIKSDEDFPEMVKLRTHFNICKQRRLRERQAQKLQATQKLAPHSTPASSKVDSIHVASDGAAESAQSSKSNKRYPKAYIEQFKRLPRVRDLSDLAARHQVDQNEDQDEDEGGEDANLQEEQSILHRAVNLGAELRKRRVERHKNSRRRRRIVLQSFW